MYFYRKVNNLYSSKILELRLFYFLWDYDTYKACSVIKDAQTQISVGFYLILLKTILLILGTQMPCI